MIPVFKKICTVGMDWLGGGKVRMNEQKKMIERQSKVGREQYYWKIP